MEANSTFLISSMSTPVPDLTKTSYGQSLASVEVSFLDIPTDLLTVLFSTSPSKCISIGKITPAHQCGTCNTRDQTWDLILDSPMPYPLHHLSFSFFLFSVCPFLFHYTRCEIFFPWFPTSLRTKAKSPKPMSLVEKALRSKMASQ